MIPGKFKKPCKMKGGKPCKWLSMRVDGLKGSVEQQEAVFPLKAEMIYNT